MKCFIAWLTPLNSFCSRPSVAAVTQFAIVVISYGDARLYCFTAHGSAIFKASVSVVVCLNLRQILNCLTCSQVYS